MLTAIIFILLVGLLLAFAINSLTTSVKRTTDIYTIEQAQILAKSGTEYAILAAQGHNFTSGCLQHININYQNTYDINITIHYIGKGFPAGCGPYILSNSLQTKDSNGTAIIDTVVSLKPSLQTDETHISYARRTIQKL